MQCKALGTSKQRIGLHDIDSMTCNNDRHTYAMTRELLLTKKDENGNASLISYLTT